MGRLYLFADETGNLDLSGHQGSTRWFGVGTMLLDDASADRLRAAMHGLRLSMAWQRFGLDSEVHASEDSWPVRSAVLSVLALHAGRVDVSLLDKREATSEWADDVALYRTVWREHLARVIPSTCRPVDELLVVAARIGTKRRRRLFREAVEQSLAACASHLAWSEVAVWTSASDPCLWAADYCVWAVGRKWETGDGGPYGVIAHHVASVRPVGKSGTGKSDTPPD